MTRLLRVLLVLACAGALLPAAAASAADSDTLDGSWTTPFTAYSLDGTQPLYTGEYVVTRKDGLLREVQDYRDAAGTAVHRMVSVYDERGRKPVSYESHDIRNGKTASARLQQDVLVYEVRDAKDAIVNSGRLERDPSTFFWTNLTHLVVENWDSGIKGKALGLEVFFSSLGSTISVQVSADGTDTVDGRLAERFKVVATSSLVRLFMKPLHLVFAKDAPHDLMRYEGRSVVSDGNGKIQDLRIVFGPRRAG